MLNRSTENLSAQRRDLTGGVHLVHLDKSGEHVADCVRFSRGSDEVVALVGRGSDQDLRGVLRMQQRDDAVDLHHGHLLVRQRVTEGRDERVVVGPAVLTEEVREADVHERAVHGGHSIAEDALSPGLAPPVRVVPFALDRVPVDHVHRTSTGSDGSQPTCGRSPRCPPRRPRRSQPD